MHSVSFSLLQVCAPEPSFLFTLPFVPSFKVLSVSFLCFIFHSIRWQFLPFEFTKKKKKKKITGTPPIRLHPHNSWVETIAAMLVEFNVLSKQDRTKLIQCIKIIPFSICSLWSNRQNAGSLADHHVRDVFSKIGLNTKQ